jgi:hypothetical protein
MKILADQFLLLGDLIWRERERTPREVYQIQTKTIIKWVWGWVWALVLARGWFLLPVLVLIFFFSKFRTGGLSTQ